ncbi:MAG: hypothetical protein KA007_00150 [Candidatus Pacebacteria bacterium]|jgi:hypothetical protein|nr:hypothetical protein [Candidatus Paceibacterota bacterium]
MNKIIINSTHFKNNILPKSIIGFKGILNKYSIGDFVSLLEDSFFYVGKKYKQKRYISKDQNFYITIDNGFDYVKVYKKDLNDKFVFLNKIYHQGNCSAYPIYSLNDAIEKINCLD